MGLDELVNSNTSESGKDEDEPSNKTGVSGQKTIKRTDTKVDDPGPDEVEVKQEEYPVSPLQCKECQNSMAVWVSGTSEDRDGDPSYGALSYCTRVFCDDSIFDIEDPPIEFDRLEVFVEMNERVESGESINSW